MTRWAVVGPFAVKRAPSERPHHLGIRFALVARDLRARALPSPSTRSRKGPTTRWGWLLLAWLPLSIGCASSFKVPAPDIRDYRLEYLSPVINRTPLPVVLQIARFRSDAIYAREAIVYRESDYATGTYPYHRWVANPASMIADILARDFSASGLYRAVQQGASSLIADYELGADIDAIEERIATGGCSAHLSMRVLLIRTRASDNPVMLRQAYDADEPCGATGPDALVGAMSRALQQISERVQPDVYDAIAGDAARRGR